LFPQRRPEYGCQEQGSANQARHAEMLAEQQRGEHRGGQRLEEREQCRRARRRAPQAAKVQRVGNGGRAGRQRDQQPDRGRRWPEGEPGQRGEGDKHEAAESETEPGHRQVVEPGNGRRS